ncbi:hypothetical protein CK203_010026 [Vitis vinifera]|uniref:Uncharacterized protein n=1 Tax=Vitis vinifera TaxID=29760 RepID=A0A438JV39_VITVI|nr:hypothetical protein CK203_010026 [Vitis vinifera]
MFNPKSHLITAICIGLAKRFLVACTSMKSNEVLILMLVTSLLNQLKEEDNISKSNEHVLQKRHTVNAHKGLSDIAFTSTDDSRLVQHASL